MRSSQRLPSVSCTGVILKRTDHTREDEIPLFLDLRRNLEIFIYEQRALYNSAARKGVVLFFLFEIELLL